MTGAAQIRCPCCSGTGSVEVAGKAASRKSEAALLRAELVKAYGMVERLERFASSLTDVVSGAITQMANEGDALRDQAKKQYDAISSLEKRLGIYTSWNSRISENPEHHKAIRQFRAAAAEYEAAKNCSVQGQGAAAQGAAAQGAAAQGAAKRKGKKSRAGRKDRPKSRAEWRKEAAEYESAGGGAPECARKKHGGQPGHAGVSRNDRPEWTVRFVPEFCAACGTTGGMAAGTARRDAFPNQTCGPQDETHKRVKTIRKRVYVSYGQERKAGCCMYVITVVWCASCGCTTEPHTDAAPGSSFGARMQAAVQAYKREHVSVLGMKRLLASVERAAFAKGAISNCMGAMAGRIAADALGLPDEEPIAAAPGSFGQYRSPLEPRPDRDTEYSAQDAALTRRSTVWTSFMPQPTMVRIMERASIDPYAGTDETGCEVAGEGAQATVAVTPHTVQIRVIAHRDAPTLEKKLDWLRNRPAMRDGTTGYEWHEGELSRCNVHINRKTEEFAMKGGLGSPQYTRHRIMKSFYREASDLNDAVEERAGGPIKCASRLDAVSRVPGLSEFVESETARLTDTIDMVIESFEPDGVTTTLAGARDFMLSSIPVPGMNIHNNDPERVIRDGMVPDRKRNPFPNWKAADNFSALRTFALTCEKNGVSAYRAAARMAEDPTWDVFTDCVPPPIMGGGVLTTNRATSAKSA